MGVVLLFVMSCGGGGGQTGGTGGTGGTGNGTGGAAGGGQTGGSGGGASCTSMSACGGDIVGTWKVTDSCAVANINLDNICAGASAVLTYAISGTLTFNADGTIVQALTGTILAHEHYPSGCQPGGKTCEQFGQGAAAAADAGVTGSCSTDAAGACDCDFVEPGKVDDPGVSYSTSGGTLTTVAQSGRTSTAAYCVKGNVLEEMALPGDAGVTSTGGFVFVKQ
jgi:hypothetical protein